MYTLVVASHRIEARPAKGRFSSCLQAARNYYPSKDLTGVSSRRPWVSPVFAYYSKMNHRGFLDQPRTKR